MIKTIQLFLIFFTMSASAQDFIINELSPIKSLECSGNVLFIDSTGEEILNSKNNLYLIINKGNDTLKLEQLYNPEITNKVAINPYGLIKLETKKERDPRNDKKIEIADYCISCHNKKIQFIDSIDINEDGVKEIFISRETICSVTPPNSREFGIGCQQHNYQQYEVWDIKRKQKIFEVKNIEQVAVTITTNVGTQRGYRFDVIINKNGSFSFSNPSGNHDKLIIGTYRYNRKIGKYILH